MWTWAASDELIAERACHCCLSAAATRSLSSLRLVTQMSRTEARSRPSDECIPPNSLHRLRHQQHNVAFDAGPRHSAQPPFALANLITLRLGSRSSSRHSNAGPLAFNITLLLRSSLRLSRFTSALRHRTTPTSIQPCTTRHKHRAEYNAHVVFQTVAQRVC
jgi:hypothetical protein